MSTPDQTVMYCESFKLKEPPFRLTPDPQFLFVSKQHARAKAYMESTIWLADGFVVITGVVYLGILGVTQWLFMAGVSATIVIYQVLNFHHYVVDSLLWKVRKPQFRATLGIH